MAHDDDGEVAFTVRLPPDLHAWLRQIAFDEYLPMNHFVVAALQRQRDEEEQAGVKREVRRPVARGA